MSALAGVKVLELSRVLAGPWSGMTLADLGADVIKLEPPHGDDTRGLGPPFRDGMSAYFACCNRNKRSLVLDLSRAEARPVVAALARWADVVIENFRTGVAEALGVDHATLSALNPRLIHCSISGYGRSGPGADRPGYDFAVQAEAGLMSITGAVDGAPAKVGVAVADLFTGLNATTAILAALYARERTGVGQRIDVSLFDSQLQMLANVGSNVLFSGTDAGRYGNAHASIVPYQAFDASDGQLVVAVASETLWRRLCRVLDRADWLADPRWQDNAGRVRHRDALCEAIAEVLATQPVADWLDRLRRAGVPAAPVNSVAAALSDPVTAHQRMRIDIGGTPMIGSPLQLSRTPVSYRRAPPALGADGPQILRELGLDPALLAPGSGSSRTEDATAVADHRACPESTENPR